MKEINLTTKIRVYPIDECTDTEKKLIDAAKSASHKAYAPYSNFKVGAALLLENGKMILGNNQENAAYPSGICAERVAVFFANANFPDQSVEAIAVAAYYKDEFTKDVISPCGACRQVLLEVENRYNKPMKVLLYRGNDEVYQIDSIKDLMPLSFGEDML